MILLKCQMSLSELGIRMRYFQCQNLEDMLSGVFGNCSVTPFGSTTTGLGQYDCDLDIRFDVSPASSAKQVRIFCLVKVFILEYTCARGVQVCNFQCTCT